MKKLIELIEKYRDKWKRKWTKGSQLRDNNSEHYDAFLHGESVGATKAYNNVLQWIKNPSIMSGDKDLALTWEDIAFICQTCTEVINSLPDKPCAYTPGFKDLYGEVLKRFNEQRKK